MLSPYHRHRVRYGNFEIYFVDERREKAEWVYHITITHKEKKIIGTSRWHVCGLLTDPSGTKTQRRKPEATCFLFGYYDWLIRKSFKWKFHSQRISGLTSDMTLGVDTSIRIIYTMSTSTSVKKKRFRFICEKKKSKIFPRLSRSSSCQQSALCSSSRMNIHTTMTPRLIIPILTTKNESQHREVETLREHAAFRPRESFVFTSVQVKTKIWNSKYSIDSIPAWYCLYNSHDSWTNIACCLSRIFGAGTQEWWNGRPNKPVPSDKKLQFVSAHIFDIQYRYGLTILWETILAMGMKL